MKNITRLFNVLDKAIFRVDSTLDYGRVLEGLERLAEFVEAADDVDWSIGCDSSVGLDSLIIGAYHYCVDYHGGQWSGEYRLQCILGGIYNPNGNSLQRDSSEFDVYVELAIMGGHGDYETIVDSFEEDE